MASVPPALPHRPVRDELRSPWSPVLEGRQRDRALAVATEVADVLATWPATGTSLAGGSAGRALLHARFADDPQQRELARDALHHAVTSLRPTGGPASLHLGAAGTGFVLAHLAGDLLDDRDRCGGVDRALTSLLERRRWTGRLDLMRGLVGIGVYALERLEVPAGPQLLARVVEHLAEAALRAPEGRTWWTPPDQLPDRTRRASPDGHVDLGIAHGVPGTIALLADACAADVADGIARPLLRDAVAWLLATSVRDDRELASWWTGEPAPAPARTAWCYGEPAVAVALLRAARAAGEPTWEDAALLLARRAAARPVGASGVTDAGLCHGSAGLGLVFTRLHQATGDASLRDAAQRWFHHALEQRLPGTGVAGFTAQHEDGRHPDPSLLTGAAGVSLALHAAATTTEPCWDRVLLLSTAVTR